ncbi:MAG: hypothetical protein ACKVT1_03885 [Dehalococcoidia bacterium]
MVTPGRAIIAVLAIAVAGLGAALGITLATDDDDGETAQMMVQGQGVAGMMSAMAAMDSDAMLVHMKEVLGEDGFQRMQQHFRDHASGAPITGMADIDQMMHRMMDGMMAEMPPDVDNMLPRSGHRDMPRAASTPTQAR